MVMVILMMEQIRYYGDVTCTPAGSADGTSEACPDVCIDDNDGGACTSTTHDVDAAETCYYTDTCAARTVIRN